MMNKYQEALDYLDNVTYKPLIIGNKIRDGESRCDSIDTLQELVDKETPRKIVLKDDGFHCPNCGDKIKVRLLYAHYCNECGQKFEVSINE